MFDAYENVYKKHLNSAINEAIKIKTVQYEAINARYK